MKVRTLAMRTFLVGGVALVSALVIAVVVAGAQDEATSSAVIVFVEGSTVSSFSGSGDAWGSSVSGTTEPQTVEVMKQLRRFCPSVQITANRRSAQYLILHERQAGGRWGGGNRNNVALFDKDDVLVYADGATQLDNSIKDLCQSQVLAGN